jgi:S1-C subfamily serine protease
VGIVTHTSEASRGASLDFAIPIDRAKRVLGDTGSPAGAPSGVFQHTSPDR